MGRITASIALIACALGCTELGEYRGDYVGGVVGSDGESFIRRGFPAGATLRLSAFDPPPSGADIGHMTVSSGEEILLEGDLGLIAPLEHDQLSQYDFPGGGRLHNYIFAISNLTGTLAGREPMIFVSLMEDRELEIRVIAGTGDEARGDLFGLFIVEPAE